MKRGRVGRAVVESQEQMRLALRAAGPDERMLALFGLPTDGTPNLAEAMTALIHPGDRERYGAAVGRAVDPAGDGELREEIRVVRPDGVERRLLVSGRVTFAGERARAVRMVGSRKT